MADLDIVLTDGSDDGESTRHLTWRDLPAERLPALHDVLDAARSAVDGLVPPSASASWPSGLEHK